MASNKEIQKRIVSVKNTAKITKAMQMISATRMKKAHKSALEAIPYAETVMEIVAKIGKIDDYKSSYLRKHATEGKCCIVVIGSTKGFVGSMNSQLQSYLYREVVASGECHDFVGIAVQKSGLHILDGLGIECLYKFTERIPKADPTAFQPLYKVILDGFLQGTFTKVLLAFTKFESAGKNYPELKKLLPIGIKRLKSEITIEQQKLAETDTTFEPNKEVILDFLLKEYFENQIISAFLSSQAAEHASRMIAMKTATDNANEIRQQLQLRYNKNRQTAITQQMLEIVGGSGI